MEAYISMMMALTYGLLCLHWWHRKEARRACCYGALALIFAVSGCLAMNDSGQPLMTAHATVAVEASG